MAESVVEIVLRIKDEAGRVLSKTIQDMQDLAKASEAVGSAQPGDLGAALLSIGNSASKAKEPLKALEDESNALKVPLEGISSNASGAGRGLRDLGSGASAAIPSVSGLVSTVKGLATGLAALFAIGTLKKFADDAAEAQVAATVLNVVAVNAGITSTRVQQVNKEIQALGITAKDSASSLTAFIQAGLAGVNNEALGKAKELARAAQDLAVVSGQNSSETFSRMIVNIQQMDSMGMRFMGVTVDRAKAEERYALAIDKSVASLTQEEQRQAFMNEVLSEAIKFTGTYEAAMGDVAKQITSLSRLKNELSTSIGNNLLPAYSALVEQFSLFLKQAKLVADTEDTQGENARALGEAVRDIASAFREAAVWLIEHKELVKGVLEVWLGMKVIGLITPLVVSLLGGVSTLAGGFSVLWASLRAGFPVMAATEASMVSMGASTAVLGTKITGLAALASKSSIGAALMAGFAGFEVGALLNDFATVRNAAATMVSGITAGLHGLASGSGLAGAVGTASGLGGLLRLLGFGSKQDYDTAKAILSDDLKNLFSGYDSKLSEKQASGLELIKDKTKELLDLAKRRADLDKELVVAQKGLGSRTAEAVKDDIASVKSKEEGARLTIKKLKDEHAITGEMVEQVRQAEAAKAATNQSLKETKAQLEALSEARKRLGYTDEKGNKATEQFAGDAKAFKTEYDFLFAEIQKKAAELGVSVGEALAQGNPEIKAAFEEISFSFDALISKAKTPKDLALAFDEVGKYAETMAERVYAAKETLDFKAGAAEVDRLNQALAGMSNTLSTLRSGMEIVAMLSRDNATAQQQWETTIAGLKGSFDGFGQAIAVAGNAMALFSSSTGEVASLQAQGTMQALAAAQTRYDQELSLERDMYSKKKAMAAEYPGSEKEQATRLAAIDKESLGKRIEGAKEFYNTLKGLQSDALSNFKAYAEKVKELDKALYQSKEQKESDLRDIARKGLSEEEKTADKIAEYYELMEKAKAAAGAKSWEKMQEYGNRAKELAKSLDIDPGAQASMVGEAWDSVIEAQEKQREEAKKAAAEQLEAYKKVSEELAKLSETLGKLAGEQTSKVLIEVDQTSLQASMKEVKEAFEAMQIKVSVTADASPIGGFAVGGMIDGPGTETSDSILAAVSKNEFISTARAVRHYGSDFYYALNALQVPRDMLRSMLSGGFSPFMAMLSMPIPRFAMGGSPGIPAPREEAPLQTIALDLSYNGRRLGRVRGPRETIDGLLSALNEVNMGA